MVYDKWGDVPLMVKEYYREYDLECSGLEDYVTLYATGEQQAIEHMETKVGYSVVYIDEAPKPWCFTDDYKNIGSCDVNFHEGYIRRGLEVYEVTELLMNKEWPFVTAHINGLGWMTINSNEIKESFDEFDIAIELEEKKFLWD